MSGVLAVVGAGTMGSGISQLALQNGFSVRLFDVFSESLAKGNDRIRAGLEKGVVRHKLTREEADSALSRLTITDSLDALKGSDWVVEAVPEKLELKRQLFAKLDSLMAPTSLLATNTSSLSVGTIAEGLKNPGRLVGMHFFNPPIVMKLVEIIRHPGVGEKFFRAAVALAGRLGRTPVEVRDTTGFLVNRVVRSYYLVAQRLAAEGAGTFSEIDAAVKEIGKVPMGPFELMDFIGLEVNLAITRTIYEGLGRPERLLPHPIQEGIVAAGDFGRKTGKGFYLYHGKSQGGENPTASKFLPSQRTNVSSEEIWERIMTAIADEAAIVTRDGVASVEGVDTAVRLAMNFPMGPFEWKKTVSC